MALSILQMYYFFSAGAKEEIHFASTFDSKDHKFGFHQQSERINLISIILFSSFGKRCFRNKNE